MKKRHRVGGSKKRFIIGAKHPSEGKDGIKEHYGTLTSARREAATIARRFGRAWKAWVWT